MNIRLYYNLYIRYNIRLDYNIHIKELYIIIISRRKKIARARNRTPDHKISISLSASNDNQRANPGIPDLGVYNKQYITTELQSFIHLFTLIRRTH